MGITSTGIGSKLDVESIVSQLMTIERQPITALQTKEANVQAKITAFGFLKGALSSFQSAVSGLATSSKFSAVKATPADATVMSASATSIAAGGTYSVEVSKLAQVQKLATAGQASSTAAIGTGTLTFDFGTIAGTLDTATGKYETGATFTGSGAASKTVTIDAAHSSLEGIRDAINAAGVGVTASIINDGSGTPYRLTLTGGSTGAANSLKISVGGDAALASLLGQDPAGTQNLTETVSAQNAEFKLDGLAISKASNTVTDAIPGVTFNLLKTTSSATSLTVAKDTASVKSAVETFVKGYNDLNTTLAGLGKYDSGTKTASVLTGDATLRSIQSQLRGVFNTPLATAGGGLSSLADIGVTFQSDGTLKLDSTKLDKVLADSTKDISTLFAAVAKPTDSLVKAAGSTTDTKPGSYALNVTQLATQGQAAGSQAAGLTITAGSNDTLSLSVDGVATSVTLAAGTYTADALAKELQSRINGASAIAGAGSAVSVTQPGGTLSVTSNRYGSASKVAITGGNGLADLFGTVAATDGLDVAGTIGAVAATGSGQTLTGAGDAKGLTMLVTGGATGNRGTVNFANGFAVQLDRLLGKMLETAGSVSSRVDGLNTTIKDMDKQIERIEARMVSIEKRFRAQFTALDTLMSSMSTTSTFLTQQLATLPGSSSS